MQTWTKPTCILAWFVIRGKVLHDDDDESLVVFFGGGGDFKYKTKLHFEEILLRANSREDTGQHCYWINDCVNRWPFSHPLCSGSTRDVGVL